MNILILCRTQSLCVTVECYHLYSVVLQSFSLLSDLFFVFHFSDNLDHVIALWHCRVLTYLLVRCKNLLDPERFRWSVFPSCPGLCSLKEFMRLHWDMSRSSGFTELAAGQRQWAGIHLDVAEKQTWGGVEEIHRGVWRWRKQWRLLQKLMDMSHWLWQSDASWPAAVSAHFWAPKACLTVRTRRRTRIPATWLSAFAFCGCASSLCVFVCAAKYKSSLSLCWSQLSWREHDRAFLNQLLNLRIKEEDTFTDYKYRLRMTAAEQL